MRAARLTLICHAATSATRSAAFPLDEPIERIGAAKARALAGALRRPDRAWTSPAARAAQTAQALGLAATPDAALRDCDYGHWAGCRLDALEAAEPEAVARWLSDPAAAPHGGESIVDLVRRIGAWLDVRSREPGHTIAVTHAAIIRAALVHALQAGPRSFWRIDIAPLARVTLSGGAGLWRVQGIEAAGGRRSATERGG